METRVIDNIFKRLENVPDPRLWKFEEDEIGDIYVRIPGHDLYLGNVEGTSKCCYDLGEFLEHAPEDIDDLLIYIRELEDEIEDLNYEIRQLKEESNE